MTGIPELAAGAENVAQRLEIDVAHGHVVLRHRILALGQERGGLFHGGLHALEQFAPLAQLGLGFVLNGFQRVKEARDVEAEGGGGLGRGPHVGQAFGDVLLHLETLHIARTLLVHPRRAAEARALVADHRLDGAHERPRTHHAHAHARLGEHLRDDFRVAETRHDPPFHDVIAAHDARGGHHHVDHRIARVGELMDELLRLRATVELAGIGGLDNDHAAALDAVVAGVGGNGDVVADGDVRDEASALLDANHRLFAFFPLGDGDASAQDARIDAHIGQRLGERERTAPRLAGGIARRTERHVALLLFRRAQFRDRPHRKVVHEGRRGRAIVHPRRFVGKERHREVARSLEKPAVGHFKPGGCLPGGIEGIEHRLLLCGPVVRGALAVGDQAGHHAACHGTCAGDGHLDVVAFGIAPHDLAHFVAGEHFHCRAFVLVFHGVPLVG